jgi:hypothetical protein
MVGRYMKFTARVGQGNALAEATLQTDVGKARLGEVMALVEGPPERIDLQPLGGVGGPES